jgi:branched-chain amino acid transport system substrate-binding protein
MRLRWTVGLSMLLVVAAMPSVAQEPIKIGVVGPHTGPAAYDGLSTLVGAQVAADEVNAAGGLLGGRKIELVPADSRGIPAEAVSAYRKVVTQDKVVAVDCCWFSSSTIAAHPTIEELKVPTTTGVAFLPDAKQSKLVYLFKFAQTPNLEGRFVDYWVKKLNIKKVAFMARNDAWGRATSGVYQARLKELGGTVVSSDFYTPGEKDFYSHLTKIKALNPEGVNFVDISGAVATQVKQMGELGLGAKALGSDGPITDAFIRLAGKAAEAMPLVVRYGATLDTPRNKSFVAAFRAKRNGEEPDQYAQAGYDSIHLHAEAIKRAGSTDAAKIREALLKSDYTSVAGSPIRFDANQQATPKLYVAVIKDGKRVIVDEVDTAGVAY